MKPRDLFVVLNTAAQVFPHVAFFLGPEQGLLIASSSPLEIDYQKIRALERTAGIRQQLNAIGAHSMFSMLGEVVFMTSPTARLWRVSPRNSACLRGWYLQMLFHISNITRQKEM